MALVVKDRVRETSTTAGTGTITLAGAVSNFQSFSVIGDGNTTYYTITLDSAGEWEVGIGTYTASGTTLSRDTVLESSNGGSLVPFSAGTKNVFCTYPAEKSIADGKTNVIEVTDNTNPALRITQLGTADALVIEDSANPDSSPFVVDASGDVIVGYTTAVATTNINGNTVTPTYQNHGINASISGNGVFNWSAITNSNPTFIYSRSLSGTVGTHTVVTSGTGLGTISFTGSDGTNFIPAAGISSAVDGTPATNDMPGRLVFHTTAAGGSTAIEKMRLDSNGNLNIGTTGATSRLETIAGTKILQNTGAATYRATIDALESNLGYNGLSVWSGNSTQSARIRIGFQATSTAGPQSHFYKSRGATSTPTVVSSGDFAGSTIYYGYDGTNWIPSAQIDAVVDNTPGTNDMPGRLVFSTTADGASTPTERMRIDSSGNVLITSAAGLGYGTGSGGTVTQGVSKTTAVTLNKPTGRITKNAAALGSGAVAIFTLNNSFISATDNLVVNHSSAGGTTSAYFISPLTCGAGFATIRVVNITAGSLSEALTISFSVVKGATA